MSTEGEYQSSQLARLTDQVIAVRERISKAFLRQTDVKWSELTGWWEATVAAEGCRLSRFNREEQQRYQRPTTAGSASSREQCLMDGEHDIDFSTVQPHMPTWHWIFHWTCPVWTKCPDITHRRVLKNNAEDTCRSCPSCEMCFFLILQIRHSNTQYVIQLVERVCTWGRKW